MTALAKTPLGLGAVVVSVLWAVGCAAPERRDAAEVLRDTDVSVDARIADARLTLGAEGGWPTVSDVAWSFREPVRLRGELLRELRQRDPARFWPDAAVHWPAERSVVIDQALLAWANVDGKLAADALLHRSAALLDGGHDAEPYLDAFVRAAARGTLWAALTERFGAERALPTRVAAWGVMNHLFERKAIRSWLQATEPQGVMGQALRDVTAWLDEWPIDRYGLAWLTLLHAEQDLWLRAKQRVMRLRHSDERASGFALRHLPWLAALSSADAAVHVHRRGKALLTSQRMTPDEVPWIDAALLGWLADSIQQPTTVHGLWTQVANDYDDKASEHGGLVECSAAGDPEWVPYPPAERSHDRAYHMSTRQRVDAMRAAAVYHFHAERWDNAEHAGPGFGDRRWVEATRMVMVVVTPVSRGRLVVHAALPGGVVVTLGEVSRP